MTEERPSRSTSNDARPTGQAAAPKSRPTIALALGGGGARGIAHIPVIEALDELGIRPVAIAGSSIGAIMGSTMAAGFSGQAIREHTLATLSRKGELAARLWRLRPGLVGGIRTRGFRFGKVEIERVMEAFLPDLPPTFEDLEIPVTAIASDFYAGKELHISSGDLRSALAASSAIPGIFRPVMRDGRLLVDGNVYNPCPFNILKGKADILLAVDVVGKPIDEQEREPSTVDALIGVNQLMMRARIDSHAERTPPDVFLRANIQVRALDFYRASQILESAEFLKEQLKVELAKFGFADTAVGTSAGEPAHAPEEQRIAS